MVWYYAEGDRQRGPISDEEFEELVARGRIHSETLIWKDGMDHWQPLKIVRSDGLAVSSPSVSADPGFGPVAGAGGPVAPEVPYGGGGATGFDSRAGGDVYCSQCGQGPLGAGGFVELGNVRLCPQCDGDFERHYQQKAQLQGSSWGAQAYGAVATTGLAFASIFSRAVAKFLDNLIESVVVAIVLVTTTDMSNLGFTMQDLFSGSDEFLVSMRPYLLASAGFTLLYEAVLVGKFGATLGKMALGIRVVSSDGSKVTVNQAVIRALSPAVLQVLAIMIPVAAVSSLIQFIMFFGYVIAVMDPQKRTLYDYLANTRVVR